MTPTFAIGVWSDLTMSQASPTSERLLSYIPIKIRRLPTDPFFDDGNWACAQGKQTVVNLDDEELLHKSHKAFECQIAGCSQVFTTLHMFEDHYGSNHRFMCSQCKRNFPSNHLLDLHVLEQHDSLFQLMATKKDMYLCLVETCSKTFTSPKERRDHVVKFHKYPSNFKFGETKVSSITKRTSVVNKEKEAPYSEPQLPCSMEVTNDQTSQPSARIKYICRVPGSICFGQGVPRSFHGSRSRGKKTRTTIDLSSVSNALQETMDQV